MRRLFAFVAATTVLAVVGCGSDSDVGSPSNGGSNGAAGGGSTKQCVGDYADFTEPEFISLTAEDKACSSMSDATSVCANDMPVIVGTCGRGCLSMGDEAQQAQCAAECIQGELAKSNSEPLSNDCLTCYGADIACARDNCLAQCLNPTAPVCATCRTDKGCATAFYDCSGLPEPSTPGAGGNGGS